MEGLTLDLVSALDACFDCGPLYACGEGGVWLSAACSTSTDSGLIHTIPDLVYTVHGIHARMTRLDVGNRNSAAISSMMDLFALQKSAVCASCNALDNTTGTCVTSGPRRPPGCAPTSCCLLSRNSRGLLHSPSLRILKAYPCSLLCHTL